MTLAQLHKEFMADLRETRGDVLSARTLETMTPSGDSTSARRSDT